MIPYRCVYWDISGVCNAACRYCPSGSKSLLGNFHKSQAGFISPRDFNSALDHLTYQGVISPWLTHLALYNWGEPFIHPQFEDMVTITAKKGFAYSLSTNASILKLIPVNAIDKLGEVKFSMPGFSQASYDKIHGFEFDAVLENIKKTVSHVRSFSDKVKFVISFHVYEFNKQELSLARDFCSANGIGFWPIYATLCGIKMPQDSQLYDLSDLCVGEWNKIMSRQPQTWICPQYDVLALDEYCNVVQCCVAERFTPGYVIGKIKAVDFDMLRETRQKAPICLDCVNGGIGFLAHNIDYRG